MTRASAQMRMEWGSRVDFKGALGGTIEGQRADGTAVKIKAEPAGAGNTQVKIQIGTFGDQTGSEAIQERIATKLRA